jgi:membrane-associated phospholipid phosphatase
LLLLACSSSSIAQERSIWKIVSDDFGESITLGIDYFNFPSRFDKDDWRNLGSTGALTLSLMAFDETARSGSQELAAKGNLDGAMNIFRGYGEVKYIAPASAVVYLGGLAAGSEPVRRVGKELLQSLVYSGIVTTTLKAIIGRSRPEMNNGAFSYAPFTFEESHYSLPSGHTTIAFAVSSVLAAEIDNTYASIGLYTLASLTGFSRMYNDKHWLSDVFLGAAIGASTGYFVVHENKKLYDKQDKADVLIIQPTLTGISLTYKF